MTKWEIVKATEDKVRQYLEQGYEPFAVISTFPPGGIIYILKRKHGVAYR